MASAVLGLLAACIVSLAAAQPQQDVVGVHDVTVEPQTCSRFRLGGEDPERASYSVVTLPSPTVRPRPPLYILRCRDPLKL